MVAVAGRTKPSLTTLKPQRLDKPMFVFINIATGAVSVARARQSLC
jgi:hypothetical protein